MNEFFGKVLSQRLSQLRAIGRRMAIVGVLGLSLWSLATPAHAVPYQEGDRGIQSTELYDQIQEKQGGMNSFDAVDPRRDTTKADARAKKLKDTAARVNTVNSDPLESVRGAASDLRNNIGDAADDLADNAKDVVGDITDNAKGAAKDIKRELR